MRLHRAVPIVLAACFAAPAANAQFVSGDLYLLSPGLDGAGGSLLNGVLRIDHTTNQSSLLGYVPTAGLTGRGAYDPFRDRLIVLESQGGEAFFIDAAGASTPFPTPFLFTFLVAPTGDGRVYSIGDNFWLGYTDAAGATHLLLDQSGTGTYTWGSADAMIWDNATNSLFIADDFSTTSQTTITRVELSPDGSQVVAETSVSTDASGSAEIAVGFSYGPGGSIFMKVGTNTNATEGRMFSIDPVSLAVTVFATSGYPFVAGEIAGAYSPAHGKAVALDAHNDLLRTFGVGEVGAGTILPTTGVSSRNHVGPAQLVVITEQVLPCPADLNGDGILDNGDIQVFLALFFAGDLGVDLNGDGILDNGDIQTFLALFLAGC